MSSQRTSPPAEVVQRFRDFGPFRIDRVNRFLLKNGAVVPLTAKAFDLLLVLVDKDGDVVTKDELMNTVWSDAVVEEGNLAHHVFMLRKQLGEGVDGGPHIETVPRRGYRFVAPPPVADGGSVRPSRRSRHIWFVGAAVIAVVSIGLMITSKPKEEAPSPTLRSIAVLPFRSLSGTQADEQLALGIADVITTRLAGIHGVVTRPISASHTSEWKGTSDALGRRLHVDAVLEGTIATSLGRVRTTARVLRSADGSEIWRGTFDEPVAEFAAVEKVIAERAIRAIGANPTSEERRALATNYTSDSEAFRLYLVGRYHLSRTSIPDRKNAIPFLEQATARDPQFALAFASLADAWVTQGVYGYLKGAAWTDPAEQAAIRALQLDGNLSEAQNALAAVRMYAHRDWRAAERGYRRALELNPGNILAHRTLAHCLQITGRAEESIAERKRALELDPMSPTVQRELALSYYMARRYDDAIQQHQNVLQLDPNFEVSLINLGNAYVQKGLHQPGVAALEKAVRNGNRPNAVAWLAYAYAASGANGDARRLANGLVERAKTSYVSPYHLAIAHLAVRDYDRAFRALDETSRDPSDVALWNLKTEPAWDPLRRDPRFTELLRRANLDS